MEELVDAIVTSIKVEKGTKMVVLKLEGCWLNVTLECFQQLVEEIFSEKSQCLPELNEVVYLFSGQLVSNNHNRHF